jgi:hypothetical protein
MEKMQTMPGHKGNANKKQTKIPLHCWQNNYHQEHHQRLRREIPRWRLEGGSRKHASCSEILEKRWRHTLQARPPTRDKTLTPPHLQPAQNISTLVKQRNQEGPWAASRLHPDGLGRCRQGELSSTRYFHRQPWARSA